MGKHTPGPWEAEESRRPEFSAVVCIPDGNDILFLYGKDRDANTHLIAAAPELLEACLAAEAIIGESAVYSGIAWDEAAHLLQVAIEKATKEG